MSLTNAIGFEEVGQMVSNLKVVSNVKKHAATIENVGADLSSVSSSLLGGKVGETIGGVKCLVSEFDAIDIGATNLTSGVAQLTSEVPGFESLLNTASAVPNKLTNVTGISSAAAASLSEIISSPNPKSIASSLEIATGSLPSADMLGDIAGAFSLPAIDDLIKDVAGGIGGAGITSKLGELESKFTDAVGNLTNGAETALGGFNGGILNRLIANSNDVILNEVTALSRGLLEPLDQVAAIQGILDGDKNSVMDLISGKVEKAFPNIDLKSLQSDIFDLDPSISNMLRPPNTNINFGSRTTDIVVTSKNQEKWQGAKTPVVGNQAYKFTFVNSYEEIVSDIRSAIRDITEVVVHWSANYIDQGQIGSEDIHKWHQARGFNGCGYHYVIKRDGSLQRGRPINKVGSHAKTNGHNKYSIGICMIGGYNCPSGTSRPQDYVSSESIEVIQWSTLKEFLKAFYTVHPGGQVWGHSDTDPNNKIDPGIDMQDFVKKNFNKKNISKSGIVPPLSSNITTKGISPEPAEVWTDPSPQQTQPSSGSGSTHYEDTTIMQSDVDAEKHKAGTILTLDFFRDMREWYADQGYEVPEMYKKIDRYEVQVIPARRSGKRNVWTAAGPLDDPVAMARFAKVGFKSGAQPVY
jgi:N-acetylmuramoyl-L-alanine amidase